MKFLILTLSLYLSCKFSTAEVTEALSLRLQKDREIESIPTIKYDSYGVNLEKDVLFYLYTSNNSEPQQLWVNDTHTLKQSNYTITLPTKFVTHGLSSNYTRPVCQLIKNGFLTYDACNVIVIDWSKYAARNYLSAAAKVRSVAIYVAEMIKYLENQGSDLKKMTLVGHSLGAHVVGLAGYKLNRTNGVGHIVGLDPAAPGFELLGPGKRLSNLDAALVEIVHSNPGRLGFRKAIGHLDYFVNGHHRLQPGCEPDILYKCSHARSYKYYAEALTRPDLWYGIKCDYLIYVLFGWCQNHSVTHFPLWAANFSKPHGTYVLVTNKKSLFGDGLNGISPTGVSKFYENQMKRLASQRAFFLEV